MTLLTDRFKIELESERFSASFLAFDCIYMNGEELVWEALMERKQIFSRLAGRFKNCGFAVCGSSRHGTLQGSCRKKLEGVVAKRMESIYSMGKRTNDWIKFKRMADEEFIVVGYIPKGQPMYSLVLEKYEKNSLICKGYVTSGVTKAVIDGLDVAGSSPFQTLLAENEDTVWVKPDKVCGGVHAKYTEFIASACF